MSKIKAILRSTQLIDKEIAPPVRCFCCQDSGLVSNIYVTEFVEIPDRGDILPFICQRENCANGQAYLKAYEMSDQERDTWHNNQVRGKDGENIPRPMRSRDYQANFSTNLNQACCDWLHDRSYDDWVESLRKPPVITAIAQQFTVKVAERDRRISEIQEAIAEAESQGANLSSKIQKTVQMCSDRDGIHYHKWQQLPNGDHERMLDGIKLYRNNA